MSAGTRRTYKAELIERIVRRMRHSTVPPLPPECLRDMSTSSLAAFENWVEPILQGNVAEPTVRALPPPREKK